jgi:hypothetical protein
MPPTTAVDPERRPTPDPGASAVAAYVRHHLTRQDERKNSLEQRGMAVITTSGVLVTLLFGLATFSSRRTENLSIPVGASSLLVVALILFVAAALAAIFTNVPLDYQEFDAADFRSKIAAAVAAPRAEAERKAAITDLEILRAAKERNEIKAKLLFRAVVLEVAAVAAVGLAVAFMLTAIVAAASLAVALAVLFALYVRAYGFGAPREGVVGTLLQAAAVAFRGGPQQRNADSAS